MTVRKVVQVVCILALLSASVFGQVDMGYITGRVVDATAAAVPDASITVVEQQTSDRTVTKSTLTGNYTAGPLKIGTYQVTVGKDGFKRTIARGIVVHAQARIGLDFTLELGQLTETITVSAETPLLQTQDASLGQAIESREIRQLPLSGRNFQQLALLAAGVLPAIGHRDWAGGFNSHGQRATENVFIVDGIDNKSAIMGMQDRKSQVMLPSLDAVQEYKVETGNYSAEYGSNSGAVMNISVRSGTNAVHGSVYEYLRNDVFDARDTFSYVDRDGDGKADPEVLRQNQFGVTLGGPILRNRSFFFGSWEGQRIRHSQSFLSIVPTLEERQGIFNAAVVGTIKDPTTGTPFPGNRIPQSRWDRLAGNLMELYPQPNFAGSGTRDNYVSGPPWRETRDQVDTRVDHNFSDNDKIFARFSLMRYLNHREAPLPLPARGAVDNNSSEDDNGARTAVLSYTRILSPNLVNEFRFGFRRLKVDKQPLTKEFLAEKYGIKGIQTFPMVTGLPRFTFGGKIGYQGLGEAFFANNWKVSQAYQYLENLTWVRSSHTVKFGADIRFNRSDVYGSRNAVGEFNFNGRYTGVSLADFFLGWANQFQQSDLQITDTRFRNFMFYLQDDWKLTPRLTLNLGLRYELSSPLFDKFNRINKIILDSGPDFGKLVTAGKQGDSWSARALINTDTNNWAPRLGLAYRFAEKWALRAGFGVFYGGQGENSKGVSERMAVSWPFHVNKILQSSPTVPALFLSNGVPASFLDPGATLPQNIQIHHWSTNYPSLATYQWNLSVQRQFTRDSILKLAYVGSSTSFITDTYDWNAPGIGDPATEVQRRVFPGISGITYTTPYGHSSYHGLDAHYEKRFSRGFSLLMNYTWGHSIDNVDELYGPEGNALQDKDNWSADRATSGYDLRHRFVTSYILELPFGKARRWLNREGWFDRLIGGWQLSGITLTRSGLPFTPSVPNARVFLGTSAVGSWRPDRVGKGTMAEPTPDRWFDTSAFVKPCDATGCRFGNSGRNVLYAGGHINFDFGLMKSFVISETTRFQFRWETFNLFNTPGFSKPNSNIESPDVGTVRGTYSSPRIMQFALRFEF